MDKATPFIKKYFTYQIDYEKKYGPNTIVFIEKGSFYEAYEIDLPTIKYGKANVISNILGMACNKSANAKEHTINNPYMCGFPNYVLDKHLPKIMNKYTIVIVSQEKSKSKKKTHYVSQIISPGTGITENTPTNYICYITNEYQKLITSKKQQKYTCLIFLDVSIGKTLIYELINSDIDEINKILELYSPTELIIDKSSIHENYRVTNSLVHKLDLVPDYKKLEYQTKFLKKVFITTNNQISIIEYIGLNKYVHLIPYYICLLQFVYSHDTNIIKYLDIPKIMNTGASINNNVIYQLNLLSNNNLEMYDNKFNSCLSVIDNTCTKMGYRALRDRLLFPITDVKELNRRYDLIDKLGPFEKEIKELLKNIIDIEKKHRKMCVGKLYPVEFANLFYSYQSIVKLLEFVTTKNIFSNLATTLLKFKEYVSKITETFDIDIMSEIGKDIELSFIKKGKSTELDEASVKVAKLNKFFNKLCERLSLSISNNKEVVKTVVKDDEYFLKCSEIKWNLIKKQVKEEPITVNKYEFSEFERSSDKKIVRFTNDVIRDHSEKLVDKLNYLKTQVSDIYYSTLEKFISEYNQTFKEIVNCISEIDITYSSFVTSKKYGYCKPEIVEKPDKSSYITIKDIRHPIIERINTSQQYVGNDINLESNGMLIYGINSSGKSSLLKAIGCSVIFAQMGMYVPCTEFKFYPFNTILTKILISDNLFKNQSTFICEMLELKNMIDESSKNTLILCDELCSSTESLSGGSILSSSINELLKASANFILTSHIHSVLDITDMKTSISQGKLKVFNFEVKVKDDKFIHNRKLISGSGDSVYGLEIAKGMSFSREFISNCFKYRHELQNAITRPMDENLLTLKKSRYNSSVYMDKCNRCGSVTDLHTHHIHEQNKANEMGFIDEIKNHKNVNFNLEVLCSKCHLHHHKEVNSSNSSDLKEVKDHSF